MAATKPKVAVTRKPPTGEGWEVTAAVRTFAARRRPADRRPAGRW